MTDTKTHHRHRLSVAVAAIEATADMADCLAVLGDDVDQDLVEALADEAEELLVAVAFLSGRIHARAAVLLDREAARLIDTALGRHGTATFDLSSRETLAGSIERLTGGEGYKPSHTLAGSIMDHLMDRYANLMDEDQCITISADDTDLDDGPDDDGKVITFRPAGEVKH